MKGRHNNGWVWVCYLEIKKKIFVFLIQRQNNKQPTTFNQELSGAFIYANSKHIIRAMGCGSASFIDIC